MGLELLYKFYTLLMYSAISANHYNLLFQIIDIVGWRNLVNWTTFGISLFKLNAYIYKYSDNYQFCLVLDDGMG